MIQGTPFDQFTQRINKDLSAWTHKKQHLHQLLTDYQRTLEFVREENISKVHVDVGQGVLMEARKTTNTIVIRVKEGLLVEFNHKEAEKVLKQLITLHTEKVKAAEKQIVKISASMREVQGLIHQYSSLI